MLPEKKQDVRVRRKGGGRKNSEDTHAGLDDAFLSALKEMILPGIRWMDKRAGHMTYEEIRRRLSEHVGMGGSVHVIKKLLKKHGFKRRKALKKETLKQVAGREQFERIAELKAQYQQADLPIISMDTKKKEMLGNFYRDGKLYLFKQDLQQLVDEIGVEIRVAHFLPIVPSTTLLNTGYSRILPGPVKRGIHQH